MRDALVPGRKNRRKLNVDETTLHARKILKDHPIPSPLYAIVEIKPFKKLEVWKNWVWVGSVLQTRVFSSQSRDPHLACATLMPLPRSPTCHAAWSVHHVSFFFRYFQGKRG